MARVHKATAAKDYPQHGIAKGDTYYHWTPFRQAKRYSKEPPKPSQVDSSRWSDVLAAGEDLEAFSDASLDAVEDIIGAIESAISALEDVQGEYEQAAEPFGNQGPIQERADKCGEIVDELNNVLSEFEEVRDMEPELDEEDVEGLSTEEKEEAIANEKSEFAETRQRAFDDALGNLRGIDFGAP